VLWHYAGLIALPATGNLGLFHDDIGVSTGLLSPPTTLLALLALGAVLLLAVVRRAHHPLICFAVLWFLAGHLLESSVFGLEIAYEHRNYLPSYGILFSVAMAYVWLSRRWRSQARVGVAVAMVLAVGFSTWTRADSWKDLASITELEARHHPISPRANELAAWVNAFERGDLLSAVRYAAQGVRASPNEAGFHINLHLYMSLLSTELSHQVTAAGEHLKDGPLEIAGLDTGITATVRQGRIQLESAASTLDVINRLLEAKPVTVHTIGALDMLRRCILERPDICQRLAVQGLKWHIIAANNPATTTTYHALLLGNAAELYAARSEYPSAVEYVGRAGDVLPNVLFYKIRKAEYLVKLGHLDEARAVLAAILATDADSDARFFNRVALLDVVQAYNEAAETGKTPHPLLSVRPEAARTP